MLETWQLILIAVIGACGVLIPYYIWSKKKLKITTPKDKSKGGVLCRIYENDTRLAYNAEISEEEAKKIRVTHTNLGRKWLKDGKWVYALNKSAEGIYSPVKIPETMEDPPSSLHRALLQAAVDIFYDVSPEKGFFQEHGKILLFVGAVIFLLWTVIMN